MAHVSYTELRQNLKKHMDSVCQSRAPLVVTRQNGEAVVMLSLSEYESLEETLHLLRDPANAERLLHSIGGSGGRQARRARHRGLERLWAESSWEKATVTSAEIASSPAGSSQ